MHTPRFKLSLRFYSQSIDPKEISKELGLEPKWVHVAGEPRKTPKGVAVGGAYDQNYCSFNISPLEGEELSQAIERITHDILQHKQLFQKLRQENGRSELFVGWFSIGNTGDTFDHDLLCKLGELQIDLALDVYCEE